MPYLGQSPSKGDENNFKILDDISSYTLTFDGSDASVVSAANDTITSLNHRFVQGQRVTYNKGGGSVIVGLSDGVYYIIKHDHNTIKLATSASNATNGTAVNITNVGGGSSHTLNAAFDGINTKFKATHTNGQKAKITRSAQLVISVNGVIQQPHDSATPSTGFGFDLDGTIVLSQAPVAGDVYWAHVLTNNNVTFDISDNDVDNFTGNGSQVSFNLSKTPPDNRNVLVTIDGVVQYPNDPDGTVRAYTVVENVLTFVTAPDANVQIQVRHIGFAGSTSGGGGVTNFYGRTGAVVLKSTDNVTVNDAAITGNATVTGNISAADATFSGNLTVQGTTTTLDTVLTEVDKLEVSANNSTVGVAITQSGSGDILKTFSGSTLRVQNQADGNFIIKSGTQYKGLKVLNDAGTTVGEIVGLSTINDAGAMALWTGGTKKVQLSAVGNSYILNDNLGIGTNAPDSKLNLVGTGSDADTRISIKDGTGIANVVGRYGSLTFQADVDGAVSGSLINFAIDGTERLRIMSGGAIGINTTTGSNTVNIGGAAGLGVKFHNFTSGNSSYITVESGDKIQSNVGGTGYFTWVTGGSEKFRIANNGRVGLGITNPQGRLHISSGTSGDCQLIIESDTDNNNETDNPRILLRQDGGQDLNSIGLNFSASASTDNNSLYLASSGSQSGIIFLTGTSDGYTNATEKLRITSDGKVGIGSAIPSEKLDVLGTIQCLNELRSKSGNDLLLNAGSANRDVKIQVNDVNMMYVQGSTGNVGINTITPSTPLEIYTAASAAWKFRINTSVSDGAGFYQRANGDFEMVLRDASNNNNFISGNGGGLEFATSGTEKLRIDSNGRLLVGLLSDPAESSIVAEGNSNSGTSYAVLDLRRGSAASTAGNVCGYIRFSDTNIDSSNRNYAWIAGMADGTSTGGTDNPGRLVFATCPDNATGLQERLRINSSGQLIMTNAATQTFFDFSTTNNSTRGLFSIAGKDGSGNAVTVRIGGFGDTSRGEIFTHSNHGLGFATNNAATQMVLGTNGCLSIGKTGSQGKGLEIYQSAYAAIRIQNSSTGTGGNDGILLEASGSDCLLYNYEVANLKLGTAGTEKHRIASDGSSYRGGTIITESDMNWIHDTYQRPHIFSGITGGNPSDGAIVVASPETNPSNTRVGAIVFGCKTSSTSGVSNSGLKAAIECYTNTNVSDAWKTGGALNFSVRRDNGNLENKFQITKDGIVVRRQDSGSEGGEVMLCRPSDDTPHFHIDAFGAAGTPGNTNDWVNNANPKMRVHTGGTEIFNLGTNGNIRLPHNPIFCGVYQDGSGINVNADPVIFNDVVYINKGAGQTGSGTPYNTSNGYFTCPSAGYYQVYVQAHLQDQSSVYSTWRIYHNTSIVSNAWEGDTGGGSLIASVIVNVSGGDTLRATFVSTDTTQYTNETYWVLHILKVG